MHHTIFISVIHSIEGGTEHELKHLPPVLLGFQLPDDYPSKSPPIFTLSCKWLNRKQACIYFVAIEMAKSDESEVIFLKFDYRLNVHLIIT